jgi:hypothetical protein
MSRPNEQRQYELVDVDASMISLEDTVPNEMTSGDMESPPTLPTGAVVDGKNTLQSFEAHGTPVSLQGPPEKVSPGTVRLILPNGQLITGKNTLQSFDTGREGRPSQRTPMDPPDAFADDMKPSSNGALPPPNPVVAVTPPSTTVVAVAVEADIVYAEVSPEPVLSFMPVNHNGNQNGPAAPTTHHGTRADPPCHS